MNQNGFGAQTGIQQSQHVVAVNPALVHLPPPTSFPTNMHCRICNTSTLTTVTKEPGLATWLTCGGLILVGCFGGCCLIPFCIDAFKDTVHYCSRCGAVVGKKTILGK